jgi:hypothetical protein
LKVEIIAPEVFRVEQAPLSPSDSSPLVRRSKKVNKLLK